MFGTTRQTIARWASKGQIPSHRTPSGRIVLFEDELLPLVPGLERAEREPAHAEAGRAHLPTVLAVVLAAVLALAGIAATPAAASLTPAQAHAAHVAHVQHMRHLGQPLRYLPTCNRLTHRCAL